MHFTNNLVFRILCVIGFIHIATGQGTCPDISPCTYEYCVEGRPTDVYVSCNATMEEVKATFSRLTTPITMYSIRLYVQPSAGDNIPANIFGDSIATHYFYIEGNRNLPKLTVDPTAFRSSTFLVRDVEFRLLDVSQVDFRFLSISGAGIYNLEFYSVSNLHQSLSTLPPISALKYLRIEDSNGLNQPWQNGGVFFQSNGLEEFYAEGCGLDDVGMAQLLDWMIPNAAETMVYINIGFNRIDSIPRQLRSFRNLETIKINGNRVDLIVPSNSFDGNINKDIDLDASKVIHVEPGAFQGNYSSTYYVHFNENLLTRFEEEVFKSMLQDMTLQNRAGLNVAQNPFDCYSDPCHLAWLLRDNRNLLNSIYSNPMCENGDYFSNLSPSLFQNCP